MNNKLFASYAAYRRAWKESPNVIPTIPLNIDIELSAVCNLQCPFCFVPTEEYRNKKHPAFMDEMLFYHIIRECKRASVPAIKVNWRGEPTLHPQFSKLMRYAKHSGDFWDIMINTNGNFYGVDKIDALMKCTKVMFSVDSFDEITYATMRKKGNLKTVIDNIRELINRGHKNIWVRRIIADYNKYERFKEKAHELFRNKVFVGEHYCFDRNKGQERPQDREYCGYPTQRLVISTNGDVFPCCVDYNETMKLGNIGDYSISGLWRSNKIAGIIEQLKRNIIPDTSCKTCTSYMAYDDPKRNKVEDKTD